MKGINLPKQLRDKLKDAWDYQKLMSLDFSHSSRRYLMDKFTQSGDFSLVIGIEMERGLGGYHTNHVIAQVGFDDEDAHREEVYDFRSLLQEISELRLKRPDAVIEVHIGYEVFRKNSHGRMDVCGESDVDRLHLLIKGDDIIKGFEQIQSLLKRKY